MSLLDIRDATFLKVVHTLQTFLISARSRRRLSQRELANIAQVSLMTIGPVERGEHTNWSTKTAASIGLALHEVSELSPEEMSDFLRLTGVPAAIFASTIQPTEDERERRMVQPFVDRIRRKYGAGKFIALLQAIESFAESGEVDTASEEPQTLRHVSPPVYRPELGGTEVRITEWQRAKREKEAREARKKGKQ